VLRLLGLSVFLSTRLFSSRRNLLLENLALPFWRGTAGQTVKREDLARNWPLLHAHIIPNGMYDFPDANGNLDIAFNMLTSKIGLLCPPVLLVREDKRLK
jgi:hypothetical protein